MNLAHSLGPRAAATVGCILLALAASMSGCAAGPGRSVSVGETGPLVLPPDADGAMTALLRSPRHGEWIDVPAPAGDEAGVVRVWVVHPERSDLAPVVIVVHEIMGLTDWIRAVADRLAAEGYLAIAPDLLSGKGPDGGGSESFSGDAVRGAIRSLDRAEVHGRLDAVRAWARAQPSAADRVACTGFCWGGSTTFSYATHQPELAAAIVWYGTAPQEETRLRRIEAPVLGLYGGDDARVTSTLPATEAAMRAAGRVFTARVYDGAGHGFLRQQDGHDGANRAASHTAWAEALAMLRRTLFGAIDMAQSESVPKPEKLSDLLWGGRVRVRYKGQVREICADSCYSFSSELHAESFVHSWQSTRYEVLDGSLDEVEGVWPGGGMRIQGDDLRQYVLYRLGLSPDEVKQILRLKTPPADFADLKSRVVQDRRARVAEVLYSSLTAIDRRGVCGPAPGFYERNRDWPRFVPLEEVMRQPTAECEELLAAVSQASDLPQRLLGGSIDAQSFNRTAADWRVRYHGTSTTLDLSCTRIDQDAPPLLNAVLNWNTSQVAAIAAPARRLRDTLRLFEHRLPATIREDVAQTYSVLFPSLPDGSPGAMSADGWALTIACPISTSQADDALQLARRLSTNTSILAPVTTCLRLGWCIASYCDASSGSVDPNWSDYYNSLETGLPPFSRSLVREQPPSLVDFRQTYFLVIDCSFGDLVPLLADMKRLELVGAKRKRKARDNPLRMWPLIIPRQVAAAPITVAPGSPLDETVQFGPIGSTVHTQSAADSAQSTASAALIAQIRARTRAILGSLF